MADTEIIKVGFNFKPRQIDIGDGKVWEFKPNLNLFLLQDAIAGFGRIDENAEDPMVEGEKATEKLRGVLKKGLVDREAKEEWMSEHYRDLYDASVLISCATTYLESRVQLPTQASANSGRR